MLKFFRKRAKSGPKAQRKETADSTSQEVIPPEKELGLRKAKSHFFIRSPTSTSLLQPRPNNLVLRQAQREEDQNPPTTNHSPKSPISDFSSDDNLTDFNLSNTLRDQQAADQAYKHLQRLQEFQKTQEQRALAPRPKLNRSKPSRPRLQPVWLPRTYYDGGVPASPTREWPLQNSPATTTLEDDDNDLLPTPSPSDSSSEQRRVNRSGTVIIDGVAWSAVGEERIRLSLDSFEFRSSYSTMSESEADSEEDDMISRRDWAYT